MLKTFRGWREQQLADGTVIWTLPGGRTYVTTPGSAFLFPYLSRPTGEAPMSKARTEPCAERTAMMPKRRRTRAQDRATRITTERRHHRDARLARKAERPSYFGPAPPEADDDPPPF